MGLVFFIKIILASCASFIFGWIWYSIFFREFAYSDFDEKIEMPFRKWATNLTRTVFVFEATSSIITAAALLLMINYSGLPGYSVAFLLWLGFIAPHFAHKVLYEKEPWKQSLIKSGFHLFSLLVMVSVFALV